jgi:low temperature requirement protein LtrA
MQDRRHGGALPVAGQVTSLELFFDLVFVFTITQLTATVEPGGWAVTGRSALLLLILWWMYGGYAWLTNAAPPVTPRRRGLLVLGMIGNFVTAMAIPHAYGADRVVFASGYALVVVVHAGMYVTEAARITRGMIVQLLGWNMVGAALGLVGALFFENILAWWWLGAFVVAVVLPRLVRITSLNEAEVDGGPSFELVPGHFVERHGLMLLIALGESVLAIGVGLGTGVRSIGVEQIAFAAISLLLAATLYWAYFGVGEDSRAEAALDAMPPERAQAAGLASYGYAFWVILFGIVLTAAGLHHALAHPTERLTWEYAGQLCVGVGLYWGGLGLFRLTLGLPGAGLRLLGGVVLGAVIVVGAEVSGLAALVCLLAGSATLALLEQRPPTVGHTLRRSRRSHPSPG